MSTENDNGEPAPPIEGSPIRPPMTGHRVWEMDVIGLIIFLALLVVLLPVLPVVLLLFLLARLLGWGGDSSPIGWS